MLCKKKKMGDLEMCFDAYIEAIRPIHNLSFLVLRNAE